MKPNYDLNSLIKKHKKAATRFPVDSAHIQEGVSVFIGAKKASGVPGDSTHINDYVNVSLQNK